MCFAIKTFALFYILSFPGLLHAITSDTDINDNRSLVITDIEILENDFIKYRFNMGRLIGDVGARELAGFNGERVKDANGVYGGSTEDFNTGWTLGNYLTSLFENADEQQQEYIETLSDTNRVEIVSNASGFDTRMRLKDIFLNWRKMKSDGSLEAVRLGMKTTPNSSDSQRIQNAKAQLNSLTSPQSLATGRFKLLAIVNRLDLADNYDARLTTTASLYPSYFGETHLVYGVHDVDLESDNQAYPQTFVLTFRNPMLQNLTKINTGNNGLYNFYGRESGGNVVLDPTLETLNPSYNTWKSSLGNWAKLWSDLSNFNKTSTNYKDRLIAILNTVARPENFIGLKSNAKISKNEYEIREWYIFGSAVTRQNNNGGNRGRLITRKPKSEPYRCLDRTPVLQALVNRGWTSDLSDVGDMSNIPQLYLEDPIVSTDSNAVKLRKTKNISIGAEQEENRSGNFVILREKDDRPFFNNPNSGELSLYNRDWIKFNGSIEEATYYWESISQEYKCGNTFETMPFAMLTGPGRNDGPFESDRPITSDFTKRMRANENQLMMLAPFGRIKLQTNSQWGEVWQTGKSDSERKRHAFAIRTCTGCHSQEGAAMGAFHITPRLDGEESSLSSYLSGGGSFINGGTTYNYDALSARRKFMFQVHPDSGIDPVRYKNLLRHEFNH